MYDSTEDTQSHIDAVRYRLFQVRENLERRGRHHDQSKLLEPEKPIFDKFTPLLKELTYGSDEYRAALEGMKPALGHHYSVNRHHPEHHANGVNDMSLLDLIEMVCDWKAASERHADGCIQKSLDVSIQRFGIGEQLAGILRATINELYPRS